MEAVSSSVGTREVSRDYMHASMRTERVAYILAGGMCTVARQNGPRTDLSQVKRAQHCSFLLDHNRLRILNVCKACLGLGQMSPLPNMSASHSMRDSSSL